MLLPEPGGHPLCRRGGHAGGGGGLADTGGPPAGKSVRHRLPTGRGVDGAAPAVPARPGGAVRGLRGLAQAGHGGVRKPAHLACPAVTTVRATAQEPDRRRLALDSAERFAVPDIGLDGEDQRARLVARVQHRPDLAPPRPAEGLGPVHPVDNGHRGLVDDDRWEALEHLHQQRHVVVVHSDQAGRIPDRQFVEGHSPYLGTLRAVVRALLGPSSRPSSGFGALSSAAAVVPTKV